MKKLLLCLSLLIMSVLKTMGLKAMQEDQPEQQSVVLNHFRSLRYNKKEQPDGKLTRFILNSLKKASTQDWATGYFENYFINTTK